MGAVVGTPEFTPLTQVGVTPCRVVASTGRFVKEMLPELGVVG